MVQAAAPNAARFFPDYEQLYNDVRSNFLSTSKAAAFKDALQRGLGMFSRPDAEARKKLLDKQALPLANARSTYSGLAGRSGEHAQACAHVSDRLYLHEGQAVLLVRRWVQREARVCSAGWVPSNAEMLNIAQYFVSQRWYLLNTLKYIAELAEVVDTDGETTLSAIGCPAVQQALIQTALGTLAHYGSQFAVRMKKFEPANDGSLFLDARLSPEGWEHHALSELGLMLMTLVYTMRSHQPSSTDVAELAESTRKNLLMPVAAVQDPPEGLAIRLAQCFTLASLQIRQVLEAHASHGDVAALKASLEPVLLATSRDLSSEAALAVPNLAPLQLTCAALMVLTGLAVRSNDQEAEVEAMLSAAEQGGDLQSMIEIIQHSSIHEGRDRQVLCEPLFFAVGAVCKAFDLRGTTLPQAQVYQLLDLLDEVLQDHEPLARSIWAGEPATAFVRELIADAETVFPTFCGPFASLLAATCTGTSCAHSVLSYLSSIRSFTMYFDEEVARTVLSRADASGHVTIDAHSSSALHDGAAQIGAPLPSRGRTVALPRFARDLLVGNAQLVRLTLPEGALRVPGGLGMRLLLLEVRKCAGQVHTLCTRSGAVELLPAAVRALSLCCRLLGRLLARRPWDVLDLLQVPASGQPCLAQEICSAAHYAATALVMIPAALPSNALGARLRAQLGEATAHCIDQLGAAAHVLPRGVIALLCSAAPPFLSPQQSLQSGAASGPSWAQAVAVAARSSFVADPGADPVGLAFVRTVRVLLRHSPLEPDLLRLVLSVVMDAASARHARPAPSAAAQWWRHTTAVINTLADALASDTACLPQRRRDLLGELLRVVGTQGWLNELLRVTVAPALFEFARADDFMTSLTLILEDVMLAHMRLAVAVVDAASTAAPDILPLLRSVYFEDMASGRSYASALCVMAAQTGDLGASGEADSSLLGLRCVKALVQLASDRHGPRINAAMALTTTIKGSDAGEAARRRGNVRSRLIDPLTPDLACERPQDAECVASLLLMCFEQHASIVDMLLHTTRLTDGSETGEGDGATSISAGKTTKAIQSASAASNPTNKKDSTSALDAIWNAIVFFSTSSRIDDYGPEGIESTLSPLVALAAVLRHAHIYTRPASILRAQRDLWKHLRGLLVKVLEHAGSDGATAALNAAACIADAATSALHRDLSTAAARADDALDGNAADLDELVFELLRAPGSSNESVSTTLLGACLKAARAPDVATTLKSSCDRVIAAGQVAALMVWQHFAAEEVSPEFAAQTLDLRQQVVAAMPDLRTVLAQCATHRRPPPLSKHLLDAVSCKLMSGHAQENLAPELRAAADALYDAVRKSAVHEPILRVLSGSVEASAVERLLEHSVPATTFQARRWLDLVAALDIPAHLPEVAFVSDTLRAARRASAAPQAAAGAVRALARLAAVAAHDASRVRPPLLQAAEPLLNMAAAAQRAWLAAGSAGTAAAHSQHAHAQSGASAAEAGLQPTLSNVSGNGRLTPRGQPGDRQAQVEVDFAALQLYVGPWARSAACLAVCDSWTALIDALLPPILRSGSSSLDEPSQPFAMTADRQISATGSASDSLDAFDTMLTAVLQLAHNVTSQTETVRQQVAHMYTDTATSTLTERLIDDVHATGLRAIILMHPEILHVLSASTSPGSVQGPAQARLESGGVPNLLHRLSHALVDSIDAAAAVPERSRAVHAALLSVISALGAALPRLPAAQQSAVAVTLDLLPLPGFVASTLRVVRGAADAAALHAALAANDVPVLRMALVLQACTAMAVVHRSSQTHELVQPLVMLAVALHKHTAPVVSATNTQHSAATANVVKPDTAESRLDLSAPARRPDRDHDPYGSDRAAPRSAGAQAAAHARVGYGCLSNGERAPASHMMTLVLTSIAAIMEEEGHLTDEGLERVLVGLHDVLLAPLQAFAALSGRAPQGAPDTYAPQTTLLTAALLDDSLTSIYILRHLLRKPGLWILVLPGALDLLRVLLCAVLRCIGLLPFDAPRIARLELVRDAADSATAFSDAVLALSKGWYHTTALARLGPHSPDEVSMPTWSRVRFERHTPSASYDRSTLGRTASPSRLTAAYSSPTYSLDGRPRTASPLRSGVHGPSRSRSPARRGAALLATSPGSPRYGSPDTLMAGTSTSLQPTSSRTPFDSARFASPDTHMGGLSSSLLPSPRASFDGGVTDRDRGGGGDDLDCTLLSERVATCAYLLARHALSSVLLLAPPRTAEELQRLDRAHFPDAATLLALQRQCILVGQDVVRNAGQRSAAEPLARSMRAQLGRTLLDIMNMTEQLMAEFSVPVKESTSNALENVKLGLVPVLEE